MNIRKLIYLPTKTQVDVLMKDGHNIISKCTDLAAIEQKEQKENQKTHDGECPKCKARAINIVDKIVVEGKGKISGEFKFGFGKIEDTSRIETIGVNHCNNCGNEWVKYKSKAITQIGILIVALKYLGDVLEDPDKTKRQSWKLETIEIFDDCCAESIHALSNRYGVNLHENTKKQLTLRKLRHKFKSVFDK
jgi:DNA-directed RNA polymerase subunit M/transcription elongation factor TFIIS